MSGYYNFDVEAIVFKSYLNPDPYRDPLETVLILDTFTSREGFHRDSYCRRCELWEKPAARTSRTSERPPGAKDRASCNGCVLSHLDYEKETPKALRERLFNEWAKAKAELADHDQQQLEALCPEEKASWRLTKRHLKSLLASAVRACRAAGFNPEKKRGRRLKGGPG